MNAMLFAHPAGPSPYLTLLTVFSSVAPAEWLGVVLESGEEVVTAARIAAAVLAGDPQAETLLYQRYHPQLVQILRRRGVPPGREEDLAHEAYMIVLQHLRDGDLQEPELLGRYLKRTAINLWLNNIRKETRRGDMPLQGDEPDHVTPHADRQDAEQDAAKIAQAIIEQLGQERDRLVLTLSIVHHWDKASICRYLDIESRVYDNVRSRAIKRCVQLTEHDPTARAAALSVLQRLDDA